MLTYRKALFIIADANLKKDMQKPSITTKDWPFLFSQGLRCKGPILDFNPILEQSQFAYALDRCEPTFIT